jgi:hypothetical protein
MNDVYTKTVLSIIAAALLALVAQNAVHPSQAQFPGPPQRVEICDSFGHCAGLSHVGEYGYGLEVVPKP